MAANMTPTRWRLLSLLLLLFVIVPADGQVVRDSGRALGRERRHSEAEADRLGVSDWPAVNDGEEGTQVHVEADYREADILLLSAPAISREALLAESRRIAKAIGCPNADYIVPRGTQKPMYSGVDIELNKYVAGSGRNRSIRIDLSKLATALQESKVLGKPILIFIDGEDSDRTALSTGSGSGQTLPASTFYRLKDVPLGASVSFGSSIYWYSYLFWVLQIGLFGSILGMVVLMPWSADRARRKPAAPPDAEAIQRNYDRRRWRISPVILLGFAFIISVTLWKKPFESSFRLYPHAINDFDPRLMFLMPIVVMGIPVGLSLLMLRIYRKLRPSHDPPMETPHPTRAGSMKYLWVIMLPLPAMILVSFLPALASLDPFWRRVILFAPMAVCFPLGIIMSMRASRQERVELKRGEAWCEAVHDLARQANVPVKRVVLVKSETCNAFATLNGTVGMTRGLLDKLEPDEIRGIIAHELGHIKAKHLRRTLPVAFGTLALLFWAQFWLGGYLERKGYTEASHLVYSPIMIFAISPILGILVGRLYRRNEREADRFAVELTGDAETYIRALEKIHLFNAMPGRLNTYDEARSSHPSLDNRIKALKG
ncbi:MAG TPA: M48 family metallopeptidase [Fimbriimonadaceae bacterium]|nr:M48 family metallopeptidase [Fimbriimonadaceae bacterium]